MLVIYSIILKKKKTNKFQRIGISIRFSVVIFNFDLIISFYLTNLVMKCKIKNENIYYIYCVYTVFILYIWTCVEIGKKLCIYFEIIFFFSLSLELVLLIFEWLLFMFKNRIINHWKKKDKDYDIIITTNIN